MFRKPHNNPTRQALEFNIPGKRKVLRTRDSWRRSTYRNRISKSKHMGRNEEYSTGQKEIEATGKQDRLSGNNHAQN